MDSTRRSTDGVEDNMEKGSSSPVGITQFRGIVAILQWWSFNVLVIIMNKWIFQKLNFKFPLTVSTVHFICSTVGAYIAIKVLKVKPLIEVNPQDRLRRILPMSIVFCVNIVLGNVSLRYIPISFMQTIKSFTPATTAAFFGCIVTSTKTILAESLLHGYNFDSINTVYYMAPHATMILALPALLLEGGGVLTWVGAQESLLTPLFIITLSGVSAFCLNFSIFYVIHATTAVTFNVAGNMKVAVAIVISWLIFKNPISFMNAIGCTITLVGCTFYGYVRHRMSKFASMKATSDALENVQLLPQVNEEKSNRLI
uniref:Sugar phosphate transporter domain-containing protein n=1 Tax=Physcomitrium patens TaxID=3218 RepID=A0A7I4CRV7_PHYPA